MKPMQAPKMNIHNYDSKLMMLMLTSTVAVTAVINFMRFSLMSQSVGQTPLLLPSAASQSLSISYTASQLSRRSSAPCQMSGVAICIEPIMISLTCVNSGNPSCGIEGLSVCLCIILSITSTMLRSRKRASTIWQTPRTVHTLASTNRSGLPYALYNRPYGS